MPKKKYSPPSLKTPTFESYFSGVKKDSSQRMGIPSEGNSTLRDYLGNHRAVTGSRKNNSSSPSKPITPTSRKTIKNPRRKGRGKNR